jgi:hypothetical protein
MSDLSDWMQSYWYELASLAAQFAILAVLVWYARTTLGILTASQGQAEPTGKPCDASTSFVPAEPEPQPAVYGGVGRMLSPMPEPSVHLRETAAYRSAKRRNPWQAVVQWLQAPMSNRGAIPWRRVTRQIS